MKKTIYDTWKFPAAKINPPAERFIKMVICPETTGYQNATVLCSHIPPGGTTGPHTHEADEIIHIDGRGEGFINGQKTLLETDSVVLAPKGIVHEVRNPSQTETLKLFCVLIPAIKLNPLLSDIAAKTREFIEKTDA